MKHLVRAGVLLVAVLFLTLVLPKLINPTAFMVDYGFHARDSEINRMQWASLPVAYADSTKCNSCHGKEYKAWTENSHRTVSCENCHGPAEAHMSGGATPVIDGSRELCGSCHARLEARPADFPQVDMNKFGDNVPCISCHNPHNPLAGMAPGIPHDIAGRTDCQACHSASQPLQTLPPPMPHTTEGRTDCTSCHRPASAVSGTVAK